MIDTPIRIGPHTLRGRVYMSAHQPGLADQGNPGDAYVAYHRARARAGVAMQITGATPVKPTRVWSPNVLRNVNDTIIPGYRRLAGAVRAEGGRMLAQLAHPGPTLDSEGPDVLGPSRDFSEETRQVAVEAIGEQIQEIIELYAAAADRCRRGELDGVEISMGHGVLPAAFLSPLLNHRTDEYGGDFERRLALPLALIEAVRSELAPDMILGVRLGANDLVPGGMTPALAATVAAALEDRVDYISVTIGNNNRLEARHRHWAPAPAKSDLFREAARAVKAAVRLPVCMVGRVTSAAAAEEILTAGDADMVGMARALIADPELLVKSRDHRPDDVRPCIGTNLCINNLLAGRRLACLVNPDASTPDRPGLDDVAAGLPAVVAGGGPGGLEAARRLAVRGFAVTLFEREGVLGGQMRAWSTAPSRREVGNYIAWQERELRKLGVTIRVGMEAEVEDVLELSPSVVVIASGAAQAAPPSWETDGTVTCIDAISAMRNPPTGATLVCDAVGGLDAMLVAERIASAGAKSVTLATSRLHVGEGEGLNTLLPMIRALAGARVAILERVRVTNLSGGQARLEGVLGERDRVVEADTIVPVHGGVSEAGLARRVGAAGLEPHVIGDALRPRRAHHAIQDAKEQLERLREAHAINSR